MKDVNLNLGWIERQKNNITMSNLKNSTSVSRGTLQADWVKDGVFTGTVPEGALEICAPTMMHSGTHILRFCILKGHYKMEPDGEHFFNGQTPNRMHVFHLNHDQFPVEYISMMQNIPVFTSLRHPYRTWQSYVKRSERDRINYRHEKFILQWRRLIDLVAENNPHYVHVDAPEVRDEQVEKMAEVLNLPLSYDWKVNAKSGSVAGTHQIDVREDKKIPQEFIDFYYQTMNNHRE